MATLQEVEALAQKAAKAARAGSSTQPAFDELRDLLVQLREDAQLTPFVHDLLQRDRDAGHFLIRACRATFSRFAANNDSDRLLFAFPCLIRTSSEGATDWHNLALELQGWASLHCLPEGPVAVAPAPVSLSALPAAAGPDAALWLAELATTGRVSGLPAPANAAGLEPAVWLAAVTAPVPVVTHFEDRLSQPRAPTQEFIALKHRVEQLAEEGRAQLVLYPPSSWANAFSLARVTHFRNELRQVLKKSPSRTSWNLTLAGDQLLEQTPDGDTVAWGSFTEETFEDIQAMVLAASSAHGVKLRVARALSA